MAKSKSNQVATPDDPDHDEWQTRDDVQNLMRTDEIHSDPHRLKRAVSRLHNTAKRFSKGGHRKSGRSGSR